MQVSRESIFAACINSFLDDFDLWLFPAILLAAWLYYPYCQTGPNLCVWKLIFHRPCFGCGITRGLCFLVHGKLHDSLRFNPLALVALPLLAVSFAQASFERCQRMRSQRCAISP